MSQPVWEQFPWGDDQGATAECRANMRRLHWFYREWHYCQLERDEIRRRFPDETKDVTDGRPVGESELPQGPEMA
jgi:hypothetical protein